MRMRVDGVCLAGLLSACLGVPLGAQEAPPGSGGAKQDAQQKYQALVQEYQNAMQSFSEAYSKAKTDEERSKIAQEKYPYPQKYAARFLAIAEPDPKSPAAVDPLVWVLQNVGRSAEGSKAAQILAAHHADSPKLANAVQSLVYSISPDAENLLRAILEKGASRETRGAACLALAQYLKQQAEYVRMFQERSAEAPSLEELFARSGMTKDDVAAFSAKNPEKLMSEAEAVFDRAANEFGDVNAGQGTIAKVAGGELNEIRHLGIGKPSPEIAGEDIDGVAFKLSDYKGKVVVVDFWGDW
jgi:hypothetical protein